LNRSSCDASTCTNIRGLRTNFKTRAHKHFLMDYGSAVRRGMATKICLHLTCVANTPLLREHAQRQVHPLGAPFDHMVISNFLPSQYSLSFQFMGCEFVIDSVTWFVTNHVGAHHMSSVVGLDLISQSHFQALVVLSTRLELLTTSSTNADHYRM